MMNMLSRGAPPRGDEGSYSVNRERSLDKLGMTEALCGVRDDKTVSGYEIGNVAMAGRLFNSIFLKIYPVISFTCHPLPS